MTDIEQTHRHDISFEVSLDADEDPESTRKPVFVDVVVKDHNAAPIIPASLRGRDNIKASAKRVVSRTAHRVGYHAVRSPWYGLLASFWALVGVVRLAGRQLTWFWVTEQHGLRQQAASKNDPETWLKLHREAKASRQWRGIVLLAELVALAVALTLLIVLTPRWVAVLVVCVALPYLAHVGRPADKPIVRPALVTPRFRKLTADIVLRAYYAAGLGHPDKADQQVRFGSTMSRDALNQGSQVVVDVPYGKTFADVVKAKAGLASGLDVTEQQVYLTKDRTSTRRHLLFVADQDPLAIPAGRTPLLDLKPRDIWKPAPFGLDERGRKVSLLLLWISILVGAQPRKGKTFAARALALYAALDPYVKLTVVDGKNSPDWRKFALVAHRIIFGTAMTRDGDPVDLLLDALREIKQHIQDVNVFLSTLPVDQCPDGKLTRELSRKYPQLRVWLLVMEEFQVYYELDDQDTNKEIASLLSFIMAVGPSAGVIILGASQKPAGVGAGDVSRLFNRFRDNFAVRFALKCGNRIVSDAVLGGDAYSEGFDASALPVGAEYRGVGYLYGASDETPTVRTYLADAQDAERILLAARKHREAAGTLTGMAAGEEVTRQVRDVLADVRGTFYAGEAWVSWQQIAERLAEQLQEHYADITPDAISAQVRALKVPSVNGKLPGTRQVLKGARLAEVDQAIQRRQIEGR
jgi:DNA segregation ATPase FtsK/SpoIIIE, S-DNA-T family